MAKIKVENIGTTETTTNNEEESESDIETPPQVETKPPKTKPQQKLVSCPNCNKEMLQKTFKYYHNLKCKPAEPETIPVVVKPEKIEVSFGIGTPIRKNENIQRLMSRAF